MKIDPDIKTSTLILFAIALSMPMVIFSIVAGALINLTIFVSFGMKCFTGLIIGASYHEMCKHVIRFLNRLGSNTESASQKNKTESKQ